MQAAYNTARPALFADDTGAGDEAGFYVLYCTMQAVRKPLGVDPLHVLSIFQLKNV